MSLFPQNSPSDYDWQSGTDLPDGVAWQPRPYDNPSWQSHSPHQKAPDSRTKGRRRFRFAQFFTSQLVGFALLVLIMILVDLLLYTSLAIYESDQNYSDGTPATLCRAIDRSLEQKDGAYTLGSDAAELLQKNAAWAMLLDARGNAVWDYEKPESIPISFDVGEVAVAAHYASLDDYPVFFWERDDKTLLIVGLPPDSYWTMVFSLRSSSVTNIIWYVVIILGANLLLLFLYLLLSRRYTVRGIAPIADALDDLAEGKPVSLNLKGDLSEVGDRLNETSQVIQSKDKARELWIRGVSHDIRTPLSMILVHADELADDAAVSEGVQKKGELIGVQALKIKNLVTDLNTASRLAFDPQSVRFESVPLVKFIRSIVAEDAVTLDLECFPLSLEADVAVSDMKVEIDPILLGRALENLLINARNHNPRGCSIEISIKRSGDRTLIRVSDDGVGMEAQAFASLEARLAKARVEGDSPQSSDEHGLGLVLVDRIIRLHHGSMTIDTAPHAGFAVTLYLLCDKPEKCMS